MSNAKRCLVLLNVGTPDTPEKKDVRRYLTAFLNDKRVIDLPWLFRKILVNGIIIPFRLKTSMAIYSQLWEKHGRILDTLTASLVHKLNKHYQNKIDVAYAMRYGNPSMEHLFEQISKQNYEEVIIFPLYPQYAMSTTETTVIEAERLLNKYNIKAKKRIIDAFFDHPKYIKGLVAQSQKFDAHSYDHVLISFHGLPNRHLHKIHKKLGYQIENVTTCACIDEFSSQIKGCYKAECYQTARLLAKELGLTDEQYSVAFQSRLNNNWMQPFSDEVVIDLAKKGKKKVLAFTPAFAIDCLETLNEIGEEYAEEFYEAGGTQLDLVPCLNDSDAMMKLIDALLFE